MRRRYTFLVHKKECIWNAVLDEHAKKHHYLYATAFSIPLATNQIAASNGGSSGTQLLIGRHISNLLRVAPYCVEQLFVICVFFFYEILLSLQNWHRFGWRDKKLKYKYQQQHFQ